MSYCCSASGEDTGDEAEVELRTELVTECWIEPQHGIVQSSLPNQHYTEGLHYHQIADYVSTDISKYIADKL